MASSKMRKRGTHIQIVKGKSCSCRENRLENMACKVMVGAVHFCNSLILNRVLPFNKKGLDTEITSNSLLKDYQRSNNS